MAATYRRWIGDWVVVDPRFSGTIRRVTFPDRRRCASCWTTAACLGQAMWFFGNLYEGVVGMPQLLAAARPFRSPGLVTSGSPLRYYAPAVPLALGATGVSLWTSW
jgi:hypothetical protein